MIRWRTEGIAYGHAEVFQTSLRICFGGSAQNIPSFTLHVTYDFLISHLGSVAGNNFRASHLYTYQCGVSGGLKAKDTAVGASICRARFGRRCGIVAIQALGLRLF